MTGTNHQKAICAATGAFLQRGTDISPLPCYLLSTSTGY